MELRQIKNGVELLGYANVPGKLSKVLRDRRGQFVEKIEEGAFQRSLENNSNIPLLLNHDKSKIIANRQNLEIREDNIGLKVRAFITDNNVIRALKEHKASGFSFGFYAKEQDYSTNEEGLEIRSIRELVLTEVSLLIGKIPAYNNTSVVEVRDDGSEELIEYRFIDDISVDILDMEKQQECVASDNLRLYKQWIEIEKLK